MGTTFEQLQVASGRLKVFPLPSAVLFPGTALPLHIFEPRYREMVNDALSADGLVALGDFKPGWESDYEGRPELAPLACAGRIAWHEALPDGRYQLLLQGLVRARVLEEAAPTHPYREARVELLPDGPYDGPLVEYLRNALLELSAHLGEQAQELLRAASHLDGGALADLVAAALVRSSERRKLHFRELDVGARLQGVLDDLGTLMAQVGPHTPPGPMN